MGASRLPTTQAWWKQLLNRIAGIWIVISFLLCCLIMFLLMFYWHVYANQILSSEARRPEGVVVRTQSMVDNKYLIGLKADQQTPGVRRPAVNNSYLTGWLAQWWPMLRLEAGKTYSLFIASTDGLHRLEPILGNPFLLLIGIVMPLMLCIVWRAMEMLGIPLGK